VLSKCKLSTINPMWTSWLNRYQNEKCTAMPQPGQGWVTTFTPGTYRVISKWPWADRKIVFKTF
jgi:hypothetical protein